jgi:anti-sigma B factor antagonist
MKCNLQEKNGVQILVLEGKILGSPEDDCIVNSVCKFAEAGHVNAVIDFSAVEWMNSRGLGLCITGLITLRNRGGDLRIAGAGKKVKEILDKSQMFAVFKIFPSVDEAVASFR